MKFILFYHQDTSKIGESFKNSIIENWASVETEIFHAIDHLENRMKNRRNFFENEVYMILVDSKRRLMELIAAGKAMEDKTLILILPEESEEMLRLAVQLYPRFITGLSDHYRDLHFVLRQMTNNLCFYRSLS